ncbi:ribosome hibernation factor-recruiting GTPase MRF [Pseudonocardia sp. CA-107938]|uniref:ribosome hibernation factor-recruiting GTPase MRF n=1 Tax=Pseudonocardia sp. CA-107938 TaxID=3240021 RepID=UPI003D9434F1
MSRRTDLVVLTGTHTAGAERVIAAVRALRPRTAVVQHDLREVATGALRRRIRHAGSDETTLVRLDHGCVSCTLREDVLPVVRALGARPDVDLVVLHLDPALTPEQVCFALLHVVSGPGPVTGPETGTVDLLGVVACLDGGTWLADATGTIDVADRPDLAGVPDDERTVAQLVVEQAEYADVLVVDPVGAGAWELLRTEAALARLAPRAVLATELDEQLLLRHLPAGARRGRPDPVHAPLLTGEPPLSGVADVALSLITARRPFHPERLHAALDHLLDGVVRARGRIWLATRPADVLWLESAGGGLQIGHAGTWLDTDDDAWRHAEPERRAAAALHWHPRWADRMQELTVLTCDADPAAIRAALHGALLDDAEVAK